MTMLEKLIATSLRRKGIVLLGALLIVVLGVYSYLNLHVDAFPDVTNVQVEIVSTSPNLSALEIERFVTTPVETSMRGLPGIVQMRSVTKTGISVVTLVFKDGVDVYFARQLIFEKLAETARIIPEGVETTMGPVTTAMGEIVQFTIEGREPEGADAKIRYLTDLRTVEDWQVVPLLKNVTGVSDINSFGGYIKQYQVTVNPGKLLAYGLGVEDVYRAIEENNQNVGGSTVEKQGEQLVVRGIGLIDSEKDIRRIPLKSKGGTPVRVADVAEVSESHAIRQGAALKNGVEAVGGIVMMLKGENSRSVVKRIQQKVKEINGSGILPDGMRIRPFLERSDIVEKSIDTVTKALREGSLLVLLVLYLFLRSIRSAVIVLLALPLSLLLTFIVMKNAGLDANLMSFGGLAISIGMIVDATIIQVENCQRHLTETAVGEKRLSTVLKAVLEVRKPSILGELIIAVTFLPILSLQGLEGKMFGPLALTVAVALLSSLLLSIFVIPVLCLLLLKPGHEKESPLLKIIQRGYLPALRWALQKKTWILAPACVLFVAACLLIPRLGTEFIPIMDEGAFDMDVQLLPGVSLDQALRNSRLVQTRLKKQFPELETVVSRIGQTGIALEARGVDKAGYVGVFKLRSKWKTAKNRKEMAEKMRVALSSIPGMVFSFSQPIQCRIDELVAGTRAQLIVKLFGEDMEVLRTKAGEIAEVLSKIRGTADLAVEPTVGQSYLNVKVDRDRIARYGLSVKEVLDVVEMAVGGKAAGRIYQGNRSFDIVVRFAEEQRNSPEDIGNILISTGQGYRVPLDQLAAVTVSEGPFQISREDGQRRIGIELNIQGRDIGGYVSEAKREIRKKLNLPGGYYLAWGGQFENQQRAMKRLMVIAPLGVGLIFFLLFITFNSARLAFLVICNLPFALIGGVFALYLSGLYLSVPASVGFIVLFGVAVLNGVVLVSYISQLRQCASLHDAIMKGCRNRLRPVLMTASIAILSLIPMLIASGPGSEIQRPLATVVVGGLFTSTLLTLLVLPILYGWFKKEK
jgi:cobalt-zinc-cadmium resistance protein CzcA